MKLLFLSHWICFAASCSDYPQIQDEEALAVEDAPVHPPSSPPNDGRHPRAIPLVPIALESSDDETALDSEDERPDIPASNEAVAGSSPDGTSPLNETPTVDGTSTIEALLAECDEVIEALNQEEREKELQDERDALLASQDTSMAPEVALAMVPQDPDEEPDSWDPEDKKQDLGPISEPSSESAGWCFPQRVYWVSCGTFVKKQKQWWEFGFDAATADSLEAPSNCPDSGIMLFLGFFPNFIFFLRHDWLLQVPLKDPTFWGEGRIFTIW